MIRNIFLVSRVWVLCAFTLLISLTAAPSFAGTQIGNQRQQVCNVIIEYPSRMEFGLENATCDQNGNLVGQHSISVTVDLAIRNGVRFTFDSNFLNGRLNGLTSIQTDAGFSFDGEIFPNGRTVGRTTAFDGSVVEGETRGGVANLTGTVTRRNGQVIYYISGRESSASAFADNQSPNPSSGKVSSARATPSPVIISEMTTVDLGQSQFCLADLPAAQYEITGDFSGRCKDRYYTGKAKLTLTPKQGSGVLPMIATIKYQSGQITGPVDIIYTGSEAKYKGTLQNWAPVTGTLSEPIGNDEYRVVDIAGGLSVAERTEHRKPSFGKLLGQTIVHSLATSLQDCLQGRCEQERLAEQARRDRKAQERPDAQAYVQQQTQIAEQQRLNSVAIQQQTDTYAQQQADWKRESDATIEDARQKQLAGLDRDGKPVPVQIARSDPPPVFVADTNQPEFSGDTHQQGDPPVIATQSPELALPTAGTNAPPPLAPPVHHGSGSDTLGTGPVPLNPVPQNPVPTSTELTYGQVMTPDELVLNNRLPSAERATTLYSPAQIRAIKADGRWENWLVDARRLTAPVQVVGPSPTPAVTQQVSGPTRLNTPIGLYPTNPGELAQPIPLGWSAVSGATRYRLTVKNQITGGFPIDEIFVTSNSYTVQNLPAGTSFSWDVAACNAAGCSGRSANGSFRTGGAAQTTVGICDASLTPSQQQTINRYYQLPSADGVTRWTDSTICSMKRRGVLELRIAEMQVEVDRVEAEQRSWWTASFSERHRIAVNDVLGSQDVQDHLNDVKLALVTRLAAQSVKNPEKLIAKIDLFLALREGLSRYTNRKDNPDFLNKLRLANFINSQIADAMASAIATELGFPISIPLSSTLNLSASVSAVYVGSFLRGR